MALNLFKHRSGISARCSNPLLPLFRDDAWLISRYEPQLAQKRESQWYEYKYWFLTPNLPAPKVTFSLQRSCVHMKEVIRRVLLSTAPPESESELLYNWRSVSQYVLVSSPSRDFWPEIFFSKLLFWLFFGAPSLTRGRVCHLSVFVNTS
jgi:hypothetical protein